MRHADVVWRGVSVVRRCVSALVRMGKAVKQVELDRVVDLRILVGQCHAEVKLKRSQKLALLDCSQ